MFRVPSSHANPTFDETFNVGFFRWLTSRSADRHEWTRRRNAAARLAAANQRRRLREYAGDKDATWRPDGSIVDPPHAAKAEPFTHMHWRDGAGQ